MLAGIIGDVMGSVYEAHQWQNKELDLFQPLPIADHPKIKALFKNTKWVRQEFAWTDDTLCTLGLYKAYVEGSDPTQTLQEICKTYSHEGIGFGKNFQTWIDDPKPYQSFANGAIMRIGFIPFLNESLEGKLKLAHQYTAISHDHPDSFMAVKEFIELSDRLKNDFLSKGSIDKSCLKECLDRHGFSKTVQSMHEEAKFEMNALQTLLQAAVIVSESNSLEEVLRNCFYVGGDSDTLGCIASNLASQIYPMPEALWSYAYSTFKEFPELEKLVDHFEARYELHGRPLAKIKKSLSGIFPSTESKSSSSGGSSKLKL